MLLNCGFGKDSWESLGQQGDLNSPSYRKSVLNIHWKDWCWSWNSNTLAPWWKKLIHWKRPWCWERLKMRGEGDDRGWDGWMASLTQWIWVWVNSWSWWWTGKPDMLQSMASQRVGHDWATELNWTDGFGAGEQWRPKMNILSLLLKLKKKAKFHVLANGQKYRISQGTERNKNPGM